MAKKLTGMKGRLASLHAGGKFKTKTSKKGTKRKSFY